MFHKSLIEFLPEINLMWEHAVLITDTERVEVITVIDMYQQRRTNNRIFITKVRRSKIFSNGEVGVKSCYLFN